MPTVLRSDIDYTALVSLMQEYSFKLGLQQLGVADIDLGPAEEQLLDWLNRGWHGDMQFMQLHSKRRCRPDELVPGTLRVVSVRLNYLSQPMSTQLAQLADPNKAYIAGYALGRDYHRLFRRRLQQLVSHIEALYGSFVYRVFTDSAPVMEKPLAAKAGLGWIGKHTNLVNRHAGSWFFLGEIYTNLPLPVSIPAKNHCGSCCACMDICPTQAIIAPYRLDARKCIAYLTIESRGSIPESLRPLIGNRIFGCDDCQQVCPWNRFAKLTQETDFLPRPHLKQARLIDLFAWSEAEFLRYTEGSAIRRLGWQRWLRNIAVALGNASSNPDIAVALQKRLTHPDSLVREHVQWAIMRHKT